MTSSFATRRVNASYRGVPFYVDATDASHGRRVVLTRLVGDAPPLVRDLSTEPDTYDVQAFVWGSDYDLARNALEAALTQPGPGELVLPSRGRLNVVVTGPVRTSEVRGSQGHARITFTATVVPPASGVVVVSADTKAELKSAAGRLRKAAAADFASTFQVPKTPTQRAAALNALSKCTGAVRTAAGTASAMVGKVSAVGAQLDDFSAGLNNLLSTPSALVSSLVDVVSSAIGIANTVADNLERLTGLPKVLGGGPFARATSSRAVGGASAALARGSEPAAAETTPQAQAAYRATRSAALASAAEVYADSPFDSSQAALAALDAQTAEVDAVLGLGEPTQELALALADVKAALAVHLVRTSAALPKLAEVTAPPGCVHVLLLAHQVYGDAARADDLVARNRLPNPTFVAGPVAVLRD